MVEAGQDRQSAQVEEVIARVPPEVLAALNDEQVATLAAAIAETRPWRQHPINIRLTLPWFSRRLFITLIGGVDRRNSERRARDRQAHPLSTRSNVIFLSIVAVGLYAIAGVIAFLAALAIRG